MEATLTTPTILVVGGGFAGRAAVRHFLDSQVPARVVLVDEKPFFEFTPSVLRCIVQPSHIGKITFNQQTHPDLEFLEGRVTCLSETAATVFNIADGITSTIPYDYCVWATGVKQAPPIKLHSRNAKSTTATRREEFESFRQKAFQAKDILIIGAGPIGVELAAELVSMAREASPVSVTLASSRKGLLPRFPKRSGLYAGTWLRQRGVRILQAHLEPVVGNSERHQHFQDCDDPSTVVSADLVFDCTGAKDNGSTAALVQGGLCDASLLQKDGSLLTLSTLQLLQASHVFIAGDAGRIPGELDISALACEKTAYAAEEGGVLAARNVVKLLQSKQAHRSVDQGRLNQYPRDAFPLGRFPRLAVVSLYKYHAILCLGRVVVVGRFPSIMKFAIEVLGVMAAKSNSIAAQVFRGLERISYMLATFLSEKVRRYA